MGAILAYHSGENGYSTGIDMRARDAIFIAVGLTVSGVSQAGVILSENWDSAVIQDNLTISGNPLGNLGRWIDFPNSSRWNVVSDGDCVAPCSGNYARHLVQTSDNTNTLYYGINYAVTPGRTFTIDFDYIASNRAGSVTLLGLTAGSTSLDPFAPFWDTGDADDGVSLLASAQTVLSQTSTWRHFSATPTSTANYNAVAFIVEMGGTSGVRGIDNIVITAVPEPPLVALLGIGMVGMAAMRRRTA